MKRLSQVAVAAIIFMACLNDSSCWEEEDGADCGPPAEFRVEGDFSCDQNFLNCVYEATEQRGRLFAELVVTRGEVDAEAPVLVFGPESAQLTFDESDWSETLSLDGPSSAGFTVEFFEEIEPSQGITIFVPILSSTANAFCAGDGEDESEIIVTVVGPGSMP